jgi:hypothetical protein
MDTPPHSRSSCEAVTAASTSSFPSSPPSLTTACPVCPAELTQSEIQRRVMLAKPQTKAESDGYVAAHVGRQTSADRHVVDTTCTSTGTAIHNGGGKLEWMCVPLVNVGQWVAEWDRVSMPSAVAICGSLPLAANRLVMMTRRVNFTSYLYVDACGDAERPGRRTWSASRLAQYWLKYACECVDDAHAGILWVVEGGEEYEVRSVVGGGGWMVRDWLEGALPHVHLGWRRYSQC